MTVMLDINILIYHLTQNHDDHASRCNFLMRSVRMGRQSVYCSSTAIMECTFVLEKQFSAPREEIAPLLANIISLPHVVCDFKQSLLEGLEFWQLNLGLDFADCFHLALTKELGMTQIYSFDKKMDRFEGVERIEPELPPEAESSAE